MPVPAPAGWGARLAVLSFPGGAMTSAAQAAQAPIRVVIADDIPELRTLLWVALQGRGFELAGEAGDGRETLRLAAGAQPDAVVLDLGMPGTDGPDLIAELRRRTPAVKVVALSAFAADELRGAAFDQGAHAYLDKDVDPDDLVATLRDVCGRGLAPGRGLREPEPPPPSVASPVGHAGDDLERAWSSLAAAPVATALVGPDGRFLKVNAALCALVGHSETALLAAGFPAVVHPEDRDNDLEQLKRLLGGEVAGYQLQERCRRIDGEAISVLCNTWLATNHRGEPLHLDGHGRPRYVVRQLVDLRESRRPEDQLAWRATHDALTGLPNRGLFLDRLEMTLARLGRDPGLAAVLVLDWTASRRWPSASATTPSTGCWWRSPAGCAASCGPATPSPASAATSSPCSAPTSATSVTPCGWPSGSAPG
jgi:PAS domain S-box-containing protein